ncbi:MAG TPA: TetR family transcriptional regulator [Terrimesophilobacter sp.]|nr:TetR family transcriptional regulator [Terrimesophilobacter sp.]
MAQPTNGPVSPRRGRRRAGDGDAREQILAAATKEFLDRGYDAASIRGIARRAGVDPALVHHYFDDKADLFAESVRTPIRPDQVVKQALQGPRDQIGVNLVTAVLTVLENDKSRDRVISLLRTALGHDFAATMLRQFIMREVLHRIAKELEVDDGELRATAVATQIVGLMVVRYGVRVEPLASAPIDEVARRIGPVVQWHLTGYPASLDKEAPAGE